MRGGTLAASRLDKGGSGGWGYALVELWIAALRICN